MQDADEVIASFFSGLSLTQSLITQNTKLTLTPLHINYLCMLVNFSCFCCRLLIVLQNELFKKNISGTPPKNQTV